MARILIVDDSAFARRLLRQILELSGHTVLEADGGHRALEYYVLDKPDAVFLDEIMDDINGLEVLRKLRSFDSAARVILATADVQRSTENEALRCGARAVITKPLERARVLQALRGALE